MLENLSVSKQLIIVISGLALLFFLVRLNTSNNRKKRMKYRNRNFGEKLIEKRKNQSEEAQKTSDN